MTWAKLLDVYFTVRRFEEPYIIAGNLMIKTTNNDIVLIGHGAYDGKRDVQAARQGRELCLVQPAGAVLKSWIMQALIQGIPLDKLVFKSEKGKLDAKALTDAGQLAHVYTKTAPDLELCPLEGEEKLVQGYIDGVKDGSKAPFAYKLAPKAKNIMLQRASWLHQGPRAHPFRASFLSRLLTLGSKNLRLYWSACAGNADDDTPPIIVPNGFGQHYMVLAYAMAHKNDATVKTKKKGADTVATDLLIAALQKTQKLVEKIR